MESSNGRGWEEEKHRCMKLANVSPQLLWQGKWCGSGLFSCPLERRTTDQKSEVSMKMGLLTNA